MFVDYITNITFSSCDCHTGNCGNGLDKGSLPFFWRCNMFRFIKKFFTYKENTDEIKVKVSGGKYFIADLDSLSKSEVVRDQVRQARAYIKQS